MAEGDNRTEPQANQLQPGQVITPGAVQNSSNQMPPEPKQSQPVPSSPAPPQNPPTQQSPIPQPQPQPQPQQQADNVSADEVPPMPASDSVIQWTASQFVAHEKSSEWYIGLCAVTVAVAAFIFLTTRDIITTIVVIVGGIALGILGSRQPRQQQYAMDGAGITVGQKRYHYEEFRSFSIVPEGAFSSIVFMPLKRFAQTMTIYYDPIEEDKIVDLLSQRLPFDEHRADPVDSLMRRIRF